jgi:penicillin G amidase
MKTLLRIVLILLIVTLLILGAGGTYIYTTLRRPLPQVDGKLAVPGLSAPVTVIRDAAGIPHIYASTARDLFLAQGYVTAQDRWWQMEFNRHTGLGRISELTGKNTAALNNDRFIRTLGWNRAAQADLEVLPETSKTVLNDYAAGVNAYITGKSGPDLAIEYSVLAIRSINIPIEAWQPLHSLAWAKVMAWSLSGNYDFELERADLYKKFGDRAADIDTYYAPEYPFNLRPTILRNADLPKELASIPPASQVVANRMIANFNDVQTRLIGGLSPAEFAPLFGRGEGIGSNNWVLSGKLTASGKPLLANDPHLGVQMPSIWVQVGLHCTTVNEACPYDVTGFTFPGVPGVVVGHNARMAWGVTNVGPDTQDLYIIKTDPNDDSRYEVDGKLETMQVIEEEIRFGDGAPSEKLRVRLTRFGPIITEVSDEAKDYGKPLAFRWVATSEKYDLLGAFLALNRAQNYDDFRKALSQFGSPSQNFVYADTDGNIAYQTPGLIPIRAAGHDGRTPIDGSTTKYDWKGYIPYDSLPRSYNPERGYIATANNALVPPDYYGRLATLLGNQFGADSNYTISTEWDYGYRAKRIEAMIEESSKHTVETMKRIHGDNYDGSATEIMPYLLKLEYGNSLPAGMLDWLKAWDFHMNMESGQAALYAAFWANFARLTWQDDIGYIPGGTNLMTGYLALLEKPDNTIWDDTLTKDKTETRDDIFKAALNAAVTELNKKLGADYKTWRWGALHQTKFVSNPLGVSGIGVIEGLVNGGPVQTGGSGNTVNANGWSTSDPNYATRGHPSLRMIVDFADFDASQWIHSTGASGHPLSDHYRDQIEKWRMVQYDTMWWSADKVKANARHTLTLEPGK